MMSAFSPLPIMAVAFLGMLSIPLAISLGILQSNEQTLFTAVLVVVIAMAALTLVSLAREEHEPDKCVFDEFD
jgi:phospholipid N-methyltransferase